MRILLLLFILFIIISVAKPTDIPQPEPVPVVPNEPPVPVPLFNLTPVPIYKVREKGDSVYADILNRAEEVLWGISRSNTAHETVHYINAQLRNKIFNRKNCFYINKGYISFPEPKMRKSDVAPFVPMDKRGHRYDLYLGPKTAQWDDRPLYLVDEWVAYIATSQVDPSNVQGITDFSVFGVSLCKAIEKHDPGYFKENPEFKPFIDFLLNTSKELIDASN